MRNFKGKAATLASVGVLAIAGTVGMGGTANAAPATLVVETTDPNPGGKARFYGADSPENFRVCDTNADGRAAFGKLWVLVGGKWKERRALRDGGADGTCMRAKPINVVEGRNVKIKVCLQKGTGSGATYKWCDEKVGVA